MDKSVNISHNMVEKLAGMGGAEGAVDMSMYVSMWISSFYVYDGYTIFTDAIETPRSDTASSTVSSISTA